MQNSHGITIICWFTAVFLLLFFLFSFKPALAEETKPVESLSQLISTALANNPELKSSYARWQMFRSRIAQASSFEDPMLMLKIRGGAPGGETLPHPDQVRSPT